MDGATGVYPVLMCAFSALVTAFCAVKSLEYTRIPGTLSRFLRAYYLVFSILWGVMAVVWAWQVWK